MSESSNTDLPEAPKPFVRADYLVALLSALAAFALYAVSISTAITGEDAGELAAAAYVLGIPHPPGYPLWCLLAHTFTWIPLFTVAWRVSLFSAFMGAATIFVMVLLFRRITGSRWASALAGLLIAVSGDFLSQSIIPEVYTLNAFSVALCWLLLILWHERREDRLLWYFAIVYGLSLANHNTMLLLGPLFGLFILVIERAPLRRAPVYAGMATLALGLAFLLYLYLPLRSLANPAVDWGNPETLANWWRHATRGQYEFMVTQNERSWERLWMQLTVFRRSWSESNLVVSYAVLGLIVFFKARYLVPTFLMLGSGLLTSIGFLLIQNPDNTLEWQEVMKVFHLPLTMSLLLGIAALYRSPFRKEWNLTLKILLPILFTIELFMLGFALPTRTGVAETYARRVLDLLPPNAILVPNADHQSFPVLYLQVVEGLRPDVTIARKYGYLEMDLFPPELVEQYGDFPPRRHEPELLTWLAKNEARPLVFFKDPKLADELVTIESCWPLKRALRPGEASGAWEQDTCSFDSADPILQQAISEKLSSYTARVIAMEYCYAAAEASLKSGDGEVVADSWLKFGMEIYGRDSTSHYNAGVLYARYKLYDPARGEFKRAIFVDPHHQPSIDALKRLDTLQ